MNRKKDIVFYDHEDIKHVAEIYTGYHPYGNSVMFHKSDGTPLRWLTVMSPYKASQVELHIGETIEISYTSRGKDDMGREWIENVRFLKPKKPNK